MTETVTINTIGIIHTPSNKVGDMPVRSIAAEGTTDILNYTMNS
jgi:hypothetical protein